MFPLLRKLIFRGKTWVSSKKNSFNGKTRLTDKIIVSTNQKIGFHCWESSLKMQYIKFQPADIWPFSRLKASMFLIVGKYFHHWKNFYHVHCVKCVRIRSYSGPHFSGSFPHSNWIRRNTERISTNGHFLRSGISRKIGLHSFKTYLL